MKCKNCGTEMKPSKEIRFECPECGHFGWQPAKTKEQKRDELAEFVFKELMRREIIPDSEQIAGMSVRYAEDFLDIVDKTREEKQEKETGEGIQRQSTTEITIGWPKKREKDGRPVTERIRNMKDVLEELGPDHPLVAQFRHWLKTADPGQREDYLATFMQLRMVTEAINEGWKPNFKEKGCYYVPLIYIYNTLEEANRRRVRDEIVMEIPEIVRCVNRSKFAYESATVGLLAETLVVDYTFASSHGGSRLCFKTQELAMHAAKTFPDLWIKFYFM